MNTELTLLKGAGRGSWPCEWQLWQDCIPGSEIIPVEVAVGGVPGRGHVESGGGRGLATSQFCGMALGSGHGS